VLVVSSMHPGFLSNAWAVAMEKGGAAVFVDSGADIGPLVAAVEEWGTTPVALLRTHSHHDHVEHEEELAGRFGIPVIAEAGEWDWDGLHVRGLETPGHSDDGLSFVFGDEAVATGDTLFRDSVGGGDTEAVRRSVMEVLLTLPATLRVLPGHSDETTIGREREANPFVRYWSGDTEGTERVRVAGRDATLAVWSPDYDGKGKALVRFDDGAEAIVGGSRIERN
jgi:hydroxyacylglutathione hydrolase